MIPCWMEQQDAFFGYSSDAGTLSFQCLRKGHIERFYRFFDIREGGSSETGLQQEMELEGAGGPNEKLYQR